MRNKNFIFGEKRKIFGANFRAPSTSEMDKFLTKGDQAEKNISDFESRTELHETYVDTKRDQVRILTNDFLKNANSYFPLPEDFSHQSLSSLRSDLVKEYEKGVEKLVDYYADKFYETEWIDSKKEIEDFQDELDEDIKNWTDSVTEEGPSIIVEKARILVDEEQREQDRKERKKNERKRLKKAAKARKKVEKRAQKAAGKCKFRVGRNMPTATEAQVYNLQEKLSKKDSGNYERIADVIAEFHGQYNTNVSAVLEKYDSDEGKEVEEYLLNNKEQLKGEMYGVILKQGERGYAKRFCDWITLNGADDVVQKFLHAKASRYICDKKYPPRTTSTSAPSTNPKGGKPFDRCSPAEKQERIRRLMGINHEDWNTVIEEAKQVDDSLARIGVATNFNERLATELGKGNIEFNPHIAFGVQKLSNLNDVVSLFDKMSNPSAEEIAKTNAFMAEKLGVSEDHSDAKELRFMITFANDISADSQTFTDAITGEKQGADEFKRKIQMNILHKNAEGDIEMKKEIKEFSKFTEEYMNTNIPKMKETLIKLKSGESTQEGMSISDFGAMFELIMELFQSFLDGNFDAFDDWEVKKEAKILKQYFKNGEEKDGKTVFSVKDEHKETVEPKELEKKPKLQKYLAAELMDGNVKENFKKIDTVEYDATKGELTVLEKDSDAKPVDPPPTVSPPLPPEEAKSIEDQVAEKPKTLLEKKQFINSLSKWQNYPYENEAEKEKYHAKEIEVPGYGTVYIGVILQGDGDTPRTQKGGMYITVPFGDGNSARHDFYPDQFAKFEEKANRLQNFIDFNSTKNTKEHIALHNENGKKIFGEKYNKEYEFGKTDCFITTSELNIAEAQRNEIDISELKHFKKYVDGKPYNKNFSKYFEEYRKEENLGKIEAKPFEDMKEKLKKNPGFYLVGFRDDKSANGSQHGGILEVTGPPESKMIYTNAALNVLEHNGKDYLLHQSDSYQRNKILADLTTGSNGEETKQREHIWEQVRAEQGYDRISPKIATRKNDKGEKEEYYEDRHYYIQQRTNQDFNISFGGEKLPLEKENLPIGKIISEDFETYLEANPSFAESVYIQGLGDTNKNVTSNSLYVEPERLTPLDRFTGVNPLNSKSVASTVALEDSKDNTDTAEKGIRALHSFAKENNIDVEEVYSDTAYNLTIGDSYEVTIYTADTGDMKKGDIAISDNDGFYKLNNISSVDLIERIKTDLDIATTKERIEPEESEGFVSNINIVEKAKESGDLKVLTPDTIDTFKKNPKSIIIYSQATCGSCAEKKKLLLVMRENGTISKDVQIGAIEIDTHPSIRLSEEGLEQAIKDAKGVPVIAFYKNTSHLGGTYIPSGSITKDGLSYYLGEMNKD